MEVAALRPKRWTRAEYRRLAEAGAIGPDERLELLDGFLVQKMTQNAPHVVATRLVSRWLESALSTTWDVRVQNPIALDDRSEPEPDVAVVVGSPRDYTVEHPTPEQIQLLVEVSDTSLRDDRRIKVPLYARAGIREVWILDLNGRRLIVHREPEGEDYRLVRVFGEDETIAPAFLPTATTIVRELLP